MANQYRFLPDFSVFENDEQNDVSTEDTSSSIMSRNRQVDTDASGTGGDFLERFYQNLRDSFKDDDKFKQTFMSKGRPKPDISELRSYVDKVKGSSGIEDALLEATGMYNPGTPSDDNSMTIKDASDGITVPKQPDVMVDELSSGLGSYLRNRANKGSSFVGEGVQMASAGSLSVEDMDLARMLAGQTMRKEAAEMGLPVVDMEEEAKKSAVEAARERAKKGITQSKGAPQGIMSPVTSDPRVDMAATGLNEDDPLGRVRPKARPEVATAEESAKPLEGMGAQAAGFFSKAESDGFNIINDNVGMNKDEWEAFKKEVAKIESGGKKDPYRISGGANKHYDGKYQMGKLAKQDAADLLGMSIGHSKSERDSFRSNPALQERAFAAFTAKNHKTLMNKSEVYRGLSKKQQSAVLGYAHNQGATAASKWLSSGKVGSDKFKTKGTKYSDAIASVLGVSLPKFGSSDLAPQTSLRPRARPDTRIASK